jgi:hypothetical protein
MKTLRSSTGEDDQYQQQPPSISSGQYIPLSAGPPYVEHPSQEPSLHASSRQLPGCTLQVPPVIVAGHPRISERSSPTSGRRQPPPAKSKPEQCAFAFAQVMVFHIGVTCQVSPEVGSVQVPSATLASMSASPPLTSPPPPTSPPLMSPPSPALHPHRHATVKHNSTALIDSPPGSFTPSHLATWHRGTSTAVGGGIPVPPPDAKVGNPVAFYGVGFPRSIRYSRPGQGI